MPPGLPPSPATSRPCYTLPTYLLRRCQPQDEQDFATTPRYHTPPFASSPPPRTYPAAYALCHARPAGMDAFQDMQFAGPSSVPRLLTATPPPATPRLAARLPTPALCDITAVGDVFTHGSFLHGTCPLGQLTAHTTIPAPDRTWFGSVCWRCTFTRSVGRSCAAFGGLIFSAD